MAESLYSDSPYLLVLSIIAFVLSFFFLIFMSRKMTAQSLPTPLRRIAQINIGWNLCSIVGICFFSGKLEAGSLDYIIRQVLFGLQAFCWAQVGFVTYNIGELVMFRKWNWYRYSTMITGVVVVLLSMLLIIKPTLISDLTVLGWRPFARSPIFSSFILVYLLFFLPPAIASVYQLLRGTLHSIDPTVLQTGAYMVGCFGGIVALAFALDIFIPLFTRFSSWTGSFHFFIWHQFFCLLLSIICGHYYTSVRFKDKSSFWLLQKLISRLEDGVLYFDDSGKIEFANQGAAKLLGQSLNDLVGKSIKGIFSAKLNFFNESVYNNVRMNINGEDHFFKIYFFRSRQTLTTVVNIAFFIDQSKTMLLQQNLKMLNEQYVEYTHDLVRYQDRLGKEALIKAEKENVLNTLIDSLPFSVWYKSEQGVYQKQNQKDIEKRGSLEGSQDNYASITSYEKEARENGSLMVYTSFENSDGEEISQDDANKLLKNGEAVFTFDNMYVPILQGASPYKILCLKIDMTEQRRLEQERNMLREQKFLHSRLEELGTMCGAFAHDYNNVLGAQIGFCQLAQEVLPPDHQARMFIGEALKATERGKNSLEELLDALRGKGSDGVSAVVFSPYMIVEDVVKKISLTLPDNIVVHSGELDTSLKIRGVVASFDRILSNLGKNAIQAMKAGGILTFKLKMEVLETELVMPYGKGQFPPVPVGQYAKIVVSDTGTGMDSGVLERIFTPFFTTKAPGEGLGLGLSSALRLLKEGNAYFTMQTTVGEGTTFNLYWPLELETKE